jgi:adhesin transport system outer membrane protein
MKIRHNSIVLNRYWRTLAAMATIAAVLLVGSGGPVWAAQNAKTDAPVSVRDSVQSTLETNPRLGEIKQNREAVGQELRQTKGRYFPRLDATAGYGTDRHSDVVTRGLGTDDDFDERSEASLMLVQPLFQGGEIKESVAAQSAKLESAQERVLDNAEALALDAVIAHLEIWRQRQLLDLTNRNVETHRKILTNIKERQRAGAGSTADVMQANGRLAMTLSSRYQIEAEVETARANYLRVVGQLPGPVVPPQEFRAHLPDSEAAVIERVERCNPKLMAYGADIRSAQHEVAVRKSSFWPKVDLEAGTSYNDQVEGSQSYEHNTAAMVRARWNLFNGGSDAAARDAALARKLQATEARQNQYDLIVEQVQDTRGRYLTARESIGAYTDAVEYNRQTAEAYRQQFVVGQRTLLDVLDAENELFQTSGQLITARVNEMIAAYRLLALMGCLIRSLDIDPTAYDLSGSSSVCCGPAVVSAK